MVCLYKENWYYKVSLRALKINQDVTVVAQLVEALRYKPEGRGFHSRWSHRNSSFT
jgi:hypothetical protein